MVWWVDEWDHFCLEAGKDPTNIAGNAQSMQLFLQLLDHVFKEIGSKGIVDELSTEVVALLSGGGSDGAHLLKQLYSLAHRMASQGLFGAAVTHMQQQQQQQQQLQQQL